MSKNDKNLAMPDTHYLGTAKGITAAKIENVLKLNGRRFSDLNPSERELFQHARNYNRLYGVLIQTKLVSADPDDFVIWVEK